MKIICIGRNYAKHAEELGNEVPKQPVVFLKPDTAILPKRNPLYYPSFTKDLQFEVELVLRINKLGKNIEERFAHKYFSEVGIGIDFTARDVQQHCKEKGLPWEKAKAFDGSAPVSDKFIPLESLPPTIEFRLEKNGEIVQKGNTSNMLFSFDQLVAYTSKLFSLKIGDLIFTGTPEGVGPVEIGDRLEAYIGDTKMLKVDIR